MYQRANLDYDSFVSFWDFNCDKVFLKEKETGKRTITKGAAKCRPRQLDEANFGLISDKGYKNPTKMQCENVRAWERENMAIKNTGHACC